VQLGERGVEVDEFGREPVGQLSAPDRAVGSPVDQGGDLVEGETEPLGGFDPADTVGRNGREDPITGCRARRRLEQTTPLVVTQRLDVHAGAAGELAAAQLGRSMRAGRLLTSSWGPGHRGAQPAGGSATIRWSALRAAMSTGSQVGAYGGA
jgi:hypothetical protein